MTVQELIEKLYALPQDLEVIAAIPVEIINRESHNTSFPITGFKVLPPVNQDAKGTLSLNESGRCVVPKRGGAYLRTYNLIVPRISDEEVTFANIQFRFHKASQCKASDEAWRLAVIEAVTHWVKTTEEGAKAWKESDDNFNIGDLANVDDLTEINKFLKKHHGFEIVSIETAIMDHNGRFDGWLFDDVLVDADALAD